MSQTGVRIAHRLGIRVGARLGSGLSLGLTLALTPLAVAAADLPVDALLAAYIKPAASADAFEYTRSAAAGDATGTAHLRAALQRYEQIAAAGGWPLVSPGPLLKPGAQSPRVAQLRARLAITGDYVNDAMPGSQLYDSGLARGVRRFQHRHGLEADGLVGDGTVNAMNEPARVKVAKLRLNLQRAQRIAQHPGRHVLVNIPEFRMRVLDNRKEILSMNVVVGKRKFATPQLSDSIDYIVFNPFWHIPTSIATREVLPKLRSNPNYLAEQRMEILSGTEVVDPASIVWDQLDGNALPFRLRQQPGPDNALGSMKFIFPNAHSVYLHDTPVRWPFNSPNRAMSHGCVRLERPADLAHALLNGQQNWDPERFSRIQARGTEQVITLQKPVPVDLVYLTAKADAARVWFFPDLYGHDAQAVQEALAEPGVDSELQPQAPPLRVGNSELAQAPRDIEVESEAPTTYGAYAEPI